MTVTVVTGAAGGIGFETARALGAATGGPVVVAARGGDRAGAAVGALRDLAPAAEFEPANVDLASLASVRACARSLHERFDRIDVLVNNAGVMATPLGRTADGFELQFGTNHLGHFLLTVLLAPLLVAAAPARVVTVSSAGHRASDIDFDDPNYETRPYNKWEAYGQSKTANILFTVALEARLAPHGVHAYAVHPGMIATQLGRHLTADDYAELAERAKRSPAGGLPAYRSVEEGAATTVWAATATGLERAGGRYLADVSVSDDHAPWALDPDRAERLWTLSEQLVGEHLAL